MKQDASLEITYALDTITDAARRLWEFGHPYRVWAFSGQMGAGKTTLIHALCDLLGVADAVSSPTFALINEYHIMDGAGQRLYHMDWYRVNSVEEAVQAGMEDCLLQQDARVFVEWPEQAEVLLPRLTLWIRIAESGPGLRQLKAVVQ